MIPTFVMTDPQFYQVSYTINPWMRPDEWNRYPTGASHLARQQWQNLKTKIEQTGAKTIIIPGIEGLPDLVFPANAAIVLDGKALMARFKHPQRTGEEQVFTDFFNGLKDQEILHTVAAFPPGLHQEGAGDCLWDASRSMFWAGWGPRSDRQALETIVGFFGQKVVGLELASDQYYHLDTCFSVLSGGEILYYPDAFSPQSHGNRLKD
jgi:N-dimethylarginine dimethylaminohydrolase